MESIRGREISLSKIIWNELKQNQNIWLYGPEPAEDRTSTISFNIAGLNPSAAASILDTAYDLAVRAGLHCAAMAHGTLKTLPEGTIRVSPGFFNTEKEIDFFLEAVRGITKKV